MEKKFEIIEEGRLSKNEMNQIAGGEMVCKITDSQGYIVTTGPNCFSGHESYSNCQVSYWSCADGQTMTICAGGGYRGATGSDGLSVVVPQSGLSVGFKDLGITDKVLVL
jgi:hypothetical protein